MPGVFSPRFPVRLRPPGPSGLLSRLLLVGIGVPDGSVVMQERVREAATVARRFGRGGPVAPRRKHRLLLCISYTPDRHDSFTQANYFCKNLTFLRHSNVYGPRPICY